MNKMLAGQIIGPRQLDFIELPLPHIEEGQLLVKLEVGSICGSDLPYFLVDTSHPSVAKEPLPLQPFLSLHELVGTVYRSRSRLFKEGDRVLALPFNLHGLGEYFVSGESIAVPLPTGPAERLVLSQPLGTVIHACRKLPNVLGKTAVVLGQGPIGQLFCSLIRYLGARHVIAVDPLRERLQVSTRMGATHTVCAGAAETEEAVLDITGGLGGDIVVEAVGSEGVLNSAAALIRRHGTVMLFGLPGRYMYNISINEFFYKEAHLISSVGPDVQRDFSLAVELVASGAIDVGPLITHKFPFARAQEAFSLYASRSDSSLKIILEADGV